MKFLVDAQLPRRLCTWLHDAGHDAHHTLDLERGNATSDAEVMAVAHQEQRIVVSKDDDFVQSHLLNGRPEKLLLIATGNINNAALENLFKRNLPAIEKALTSGHFVELGQDWLVVHS